MKKILKIQRMLAVVLIICLLLSMTACKSKSEGIKETLSEFESACRELDVNAMLNCIDPDIAQPIKIGLIVYGKTTGSSIEQTLGEVVTSVFGQNYDPKEFLSNISFEDMKIKAKKRTAKVKCNIVYNIYGEDFKQKATISMMREEDDEKWYISGIELQ